MMSKIMNPWVVFVAVLSLYLIRIITKKKKKKLLILDLNGILPDFVDKPPKNYKPDIKIGFFKRPFCDDFLKFCFANFQVGVWSSRMKNMDRLVDFLFGDMKHQLLFCWDQSRCTEPGLTIGQLGIKTNEKKQKSLFLKELKKIWITCDANFPWENGEYNESNTLLLDDSPYKAMFNPPNTAVFPTSYTFQSENDNSLGPGGDIRVYLQGLAMAENVQIYVEQHPFGQAPIDPSSNLYHRVLSRTKHNELTGGRGISSNQSQQGVPYVRTKYEHSLKVIPSPLATIDGPDKSSSRKHFNLQTIGHESTSSKAGERETPKALKKERVAARENIGRNQYYGSVPFIRGRGKGVKGRGRGHPSGAVAPEQNSQGRGRQTRARGRENMGFDRVQLMGVSETQTLTHTIPDKDANVSCPKMA